MLKKLLSRWPVIQQLKTGSDGTGPEAMSERTRNLQPRNAGAHVARSVCRIVAWDVASSFITVKGS